MLRMQHALNNTELAEHYLRLIEDLDASYLDLQHPETKCGKDKLTGLFLPSVPAGYVKARNKIMIIGRETRAWKVLKADEQFIDHASYVARALAVHQQHSIEELAKIKESAGHSYFRFVRKIQAQSGGDGIIHANLFCFAWNKGSPFKSPYLETIKRYSESLLKFQIDYFQPDIIIFAHGQEGAKFRQQLFPNEGKSNVCLPTEHTNKHPHNIKYLWEFNLYGLYHCYRILHPANCSQPSRAAQDYLISILPKA